MKCAILCNKSETSGGLAQIYTMLDILYQDGALIAINKPAGLLVHRTPMAADVSEFALQQLRDQVGHHVHPVHRLDRKTSGVLLFSVDEAVGSQVSRQFAEKAVKKTYLAIVRGHTEMRGTINHPLKRKDGKVQEAITHYRTLLQCDLNVPFGKHPTSRYSLVQVVPETGRMHQIRKHFAHIFHPIIGDRPHGCNKQNRLFKEKWGLDQMLLHARTLTFTHPASQREITVSAPVSGEFQRMMKLMGFEPERLLVL